MSHAEFYLDEKKHIMFKCEHENHFVALYGHWSVVQEKPLTVVPSVHVINCGCHGFITDGKWVSV